MSFCSRPIGAPQWTKRKCPECGEEHNYFSRGSWDWKPKLCGRCLDKELERRIHKMNEEFLEALEQTTQELLKMDNEAFRKLVQKHADGDIAKFINDSGVFQESREEELKREIDRLRMCIFEYCAKTRILPSEILPEYKEEHNGQAGKHYPEALKEIQRLKGKLKEIESELYGQGYKVLGFHLNGDSEPLDTWFENNDWILDERKRDDDVATPKK